MSRLIRFGPFEADLANGELRKNGRPVRIQEQPFQILAALLEHPGEVVTRDQLRERLWPGDSYGDFDQGLNTAVAKLREALVDSPAEPKFIETLPKRGYRFSYPIEQPEPPPRKRRLVWAAIGGIAILGLAASWMIRPAPEVHRPLRRFAIRPPEVLPDPGLPVGRYAAISPNGRHIAIVAGERQKRLWLHDLASGQSKLLEGATGAADPFWSPDSRNIAFWARPVLKKISLDGGAPILLWDPKDGKLSHFLGGAWSLDGRTIVVSAGTPARLFRIPAEGGAATEIVRQKEGGWGSVYHPRFLPGFPDGRTLIYASNPDIVLHELDSGRKTVLGRGYSPVVSPSGHLLYRPHNGHNGSEELWAQPFSPDSGKITGKAFRIAQRAGLASVSLDGTLVYDDPVADQDLAWFARNGVRTGVVAKGLSLASFPAISPDGRFAAVEVLADHNPDIWVVDLERGSRVRISDHIATEILPVWSADGKELVYGSYRNPATHLFLRRSDASAGETAFLDAPENLRPGDFSRDGRYFLYSRNHPTHRADIWYLARGVNGKWEPHVFLQTSAAEAGARFSPDGRYVLYQSDESGQMEAYVRPFPEGSRKWIVSPNGANQLRWSRNGREIFFVESGTLFAVPVKTTPEFSLGHPVRLFAHRSLTISADANYDVSPDGQRILMAERPERERFIRVVENWFEEFRGKQ